MSTMSLTNIAALSAALDGDESLTDKYHNGLRGLRNSGAINADVSESGARGGYGPEKAALARVLLVALQSTGTRMMPIALGQWFAENPADPATARAAAGVTWTPPSRGDALVQRAGAGEPIAIIAELVHPRGGVGVTWIFRVDEPISDLKRAARLVREATRAEKYETRAAIVLPFADLVKPVLDLMAD